MRVVITGTPGTGKTTVSEKLKEDFEVIHLTEFIKNNDLGFKNTENVQEVDLDKMKEKFNSKYGDEEDLVIEGHLSHFIQADLCIVLRCHPETLRTRLSQRDYSTSKINENVESEMIDRILLEAVDLQDKVYEIDTTEKNPEESLEQIKQAIESKEENYGNIDWMDSI